MQIRVPGRGCGIAIAAAIAHHEGKVEADRKSHGDNAFRQLHDGAVHNGLNPTSEHLAEMRAMVDRDIEHAMKHHPSNDVLALLRTQQKMVAYDTAVTEADGDDELFVLIDDTDFAIYGEFLPEPGAVSTEESEQPFSLGIEVTA